MSIYKDLLFLDGFRVPAEYVEDVATAPRKPPSAQIPAAPSPEPRATVGAATPRWRRALRGVAAAAEVAAPGSPGHCG